MFKNYLLTAWRAIIDNKLNSMLNILGLLVGLTASFLLWLYALDELHYDSFQPNVDNSYRIVRAYPDTGAGVEGIAVTPANLGNVVESQLNRQITNVTYFSSASSHWKLFKDNEQITNLSLVAAQGNLDSFFDFEILYGEGIESLYRPNQLMISKSQAKRIFGRDNVVGETLFLNNDVTLNIAGVFKDTARNSHAGFDTIYSMETLRQDSPSLFNRYNANFFYTYIQLSPGVDSDSVASTLSEVFQKITSSEVELILQPMKSIHLHSDYIAELKPNGSYTSVQLAITLSIFILAIACFNFINLTTATASLRAKEVGIRKVLGATKSQLVCQFLVESILIVLLAGVMAVFCVEALMPILNYFTNKDISLTYSLEGGIFFCGLIVVLGIISGSYPAFFLSSFNLLKVISGEMATGNSSQYLRRALITFQSLIVVILLILASSFYLQVSFLKSVPLGYSKANILVLPEIEAKELSSSYDTFEQEVLNIPGINSVTSGEQLPTMSFNMMPSVNLPHSGIVLEDVPLVGVNYSYMTTFNVNILAGRDFSRDFSGDFYKYSNNENTAKAGVIINESAARAAGWKDLEDAIGQSWNWSGIKGNVVGVIDDIHFTSAHESVVPMFFALGVYDLEMEYIAVNFSSENYTFVAQEVTKIFTRLFGYSTPYIELLDRRFDRLYEKEDLQTKLLIMFAGLIIVICCFGLVGLALFSSEQRHKEIALRKVLGASVFQLVKLITKDFIALVAVASVIALPIAYLVVSYWLEGFAVRIDVPWSSFLFATTTALVITWITVAIVSLKYALMRPISSLKRY